jgi:LmbE family N-acetylglucosaminyl deacetylase
MAKQLKLAAKHALIIVAHPDDETIWMGGTMARHKDISWTIFVLCRKSDPDRAPKFRKVAAYYGARGIICDLEDEGAPAEYNPSEIKKVIREKLPKETFDVIFTHGSNGEYGHPRHRGVHHAVKQMVKSGELETKQHFYFAYQLDKKKRVAVPRANAKYYTELSHREWQAKRTVVKKLYGFRPHIFENRSSGKIEAFV